jgi:pimeloyl-ACP methyl ester carboxylesterase
MPTGWMPWWPKETAATLALEEARLNGTAAAGEAFVRKVWGEKGWERMSPAQQEIKRVEGAALVAEVSNMRTLPALTADELRAVTIPIRVGTGEQTTPYHRRGALELADLIGQRPVDVIPGAGHGAHLSHPHDFAAWINEVVALATPSV